MTKKLTERDKMIRAVARVIAERGGYGWPPYDCMRTPIKDDLIQQVTVNFDDIEEAGFQVVAKTVG